MRHQACGMIELAVSHARARAHTLHVTRRNAAHVAHAVLVRQIAFQDVTDDFHVLVAMRAKTSAGRHAILVDHA